MEVENYYEEARAGRSEVSSFENVYFHADGHWIYSNNGLRTWCRITEEQVEDFWNATGFYTRGIPNG
jgi:hypothetical protein